LLFITKYDELVLPKNQLSEIDSYQRTIR